MGKDAFLKHHAPDLSQMGQKCQVQVHKVNNLGIEAILAEVQKLQTYRQVHMHKSFSVIQLISLVAVLYHMCTCACTVI